MTSKVGRTKLWTKRKIDDKGFQIECTDPILAVIIATKCSELPQNWATGGFVCRRFGAANETNGKLGRVHMRGIKS